MANRFPTSSVYVLMLFGFAAAGFFQQSCSDGFVLSASFRPIRSRLLLLSGNDNGRGVVFVKMGGYDSTVGVDPSTPIQFFMLPNNTCPYAARTKIALLELGIPFDAVEVSFGGQEKPDWYLRINPRGKVPALCLPAHKNKVIYESAICNEFLCDFVAAKNENESSSLMPSEPFQRADIRLLNDHCDNVFLKTQFTFLMNKDESKDDDMIREMEDALTVYEEALVAGDGPYLLGEQFTLADVHLVPFFERLIVSLKHFKGYELPVGKFPNLLSWYYDACAPRDSVQESAITKDKILEIYKRFVEVDYSFGGLNKN